MFLKTARLPYSIYFSLLVVLYIMAFNIEPNSESYGTFYFFSKPVILLMALSLIFAMRVIVRLYKGNPAVVFMKLSKVPLLIIASHIPFIIIGKPFSSHGGWWILYALIVVSLPLSLILYGIGFIIQKKQNSKKQVLRY